MYDMREGTDRAIAPSSMRFFLTAVHKMYKERHDSSPTPSSLPAFPIYFYRSCLPSLLTLINRSCPHHASLRRSFLVGLVQPQRKE